MLREHFGVVYRAEDLQALISYGESRPNFLGFVIEPSSNTPPFELPLIFSFLKRIPDTGTYQKVPLPWDLDPVGRIEGDAAKTGFAGKEGVKHRFDFSFLSFAALKIMVPYANNICVSGAYVEFGNKIYESREFDSSRPYFTFKLESDLIETKKQLMADLEKEGVAISNKPELEEALRKTRMRTRLRNMVRIFKRRVLEIVEDFPQISREIEQLNLLDPERFNEALESEGSLEKLGNTLVRNLKEKTARFVAQISEVAGPSKQAILIRIEEDMNELLAYLSKEIKSGSPVDIGGTASTLVLPPCPPDWHNNGF